MATLLNDNNNLQESEARPHTQLQEEGKDCLQQLEKEERKPMTAHPPTVFILVELYLAHMTSNINLQHCKTSRYHLNISG